MGGGRSGATAPATPARLGLHLAIRTPGRRTGLAIDYRRIRRDAVDEQLAAAARTAATVASALEVEQMPVDGLPEQVLEAESVDAALVVLGDRGLGGLTGLLIGSVSVALATHARCPVVVIRGPESDTMAPRTEPVVIGVDETPAGGAAVAFAAAALRGVPLVAVHAWQDQLIDPRMATLLDFDAIAAAEREVLAERLAGWSEKYPDVSVRRLVVRDRAAHALVQESGAAQLLVVGSRGRGGLTGMLLGSVSHAVLHHAHCPVAVIRPPMAAAVNRGADRPVGP
jgi:nucleotide-binding universal stress UspA family protein